MIISRIRWAGRVASFIAKPSIKYEIHLSQGKPDTETCGSDVVDRTFCGYKWKPMVVYFL